jgi:hypothetical protein
MDQNEQNSNFVKEINKIMDELENANVENFVQNKLAIWDTIFKRFLYKDGQMVLYVHDGMRLNTKKKIDEALRCGINHPVIDSANAVSLIIDNIEIGFFNPDEVDVPFQL